MSSHWRCAHFHLQALHHHLRVTRRELLRIKVAANDAAIIFEGLMLGDPRVMALYGAAWERAKQSKIMDFDIATKGEWVCTLRFPTDALYQHRGAALRKYLQEAMVKSWNERDHNPRPVVMTPERESRTIEPPRHSIEVKESHEWVANRLALLEEKHQYHKDLNKK